MVDQLERRAVGPLQVLEHDHGGPAGGHAGHDPDHHLGHPEGRERRRSEGLGRGRPRPETEHQLDPDIGILPAGPQKAGEPVTGQPGRNRRVGVVPDPQPATQQPAQRPEGNVPLVGGAGQHDPTEVGRRTRGGDPSLLQEPALAHATVADDDEETGVAVQGGVHRFGQDGGLFFPPHQGDVVAGNDGADDRRQDRPGRDQGGLALQAQVLSRAPLEAALGQAPGGGPDEDGTRLGHGLEPGGGVHGVARRPVLHV